MFRSVTFGISGKIGLPAHAELEIGIHVRTICVCAAFQEVYCKGNVTNLSGWQHRHGKRELFQNAGSRREDIRIYLEFNGDGDGGGS